MEKRVEMRPTGRSDGKPKDGSTDKSDGRPMDETVFLLVSEIYQCCNLMVVGNSDNLREMAYGKAIGIITTLDMFGYLINDLELSERQIITKYFSMRAGKTGPSFDAMARATDILDDLPFRDAQGRIARGALDCSILRD